MNSDVSVQNIFPNFIGTKSLDLSKLKVLGTTFKKTFESNIKTTIDSETLFDVDSMNYLNIELTTILSHLLKNKCKTFVFKMMGIWINKYSNNDFQGTHIHPSSFSFIIYYDTDKSYTVFNSPVKNLLDAINLNKNKIFSKEYEPNLKKGDIILFPSYLEHWVRPNSNGITLAGNINIIETQ